MEETKPVEAKNPAPVQTTELAPQQQTEIAVKSANTDIWTSMVEKYGAPKTAEFLSQSSFVPESYRGKAADCLIALDFSQRVGVAPLTVMQNMSVVKGKPSWSGQFCMALINANPAFSNARLVYTGTKGTDNRGAYVTALRSSDGSRVDGTEVTMAMAKSEGWTNNAKWRNMPEQMLGYRAAAFFARLHCPEALLGLQTSEEVEDVDATRAGTAARNLTAAIRGGM